MKLLYAFIATMLLATPLQAQDYRAFAADVFGNTATGVGDTRSEARENARRYCRRSFGTPCGNTLSTWWSDYFTVLHCNDGYQQNSFIYASEHSFSGSLRGALNDAYDIGGFRKESCIIIRRFHE